MTEKNKVPDGRDLGEQKPKILGEQEWDKAGSILNSTAHPGDKLRNLMTRKPRYERKF